MDRHLVTPGNLVGAGRPTALATITRIDPIYVYFTMNERDLLRLVGILGQAGDLQGNGIPVFAGLEGEEGYPSEGRLDFASTGLDPGTGTILLRAVYHKPPERGRRTRHGSGDVRAAAHPHRRPRQGASGLRAALGVDQGGRYLLMVNDKNVVEQRPVKTGALVNGMRVIEEGPQGPTTGSWSAGSSAPGPAPR